MKRIQNLSIRILSVLLLAIPACEDKDEKDRPQELVGTWFMHCLLYTSPSPRDRG